MSANAYLAPSSSDLEKTSLRVVVTVHSTVQRGKRIAREATSDLLPSRKRARFGEAELAPSTSLGQKEAVPPSNSQYSEMIHATSSAFDCLCYAAISLLSSGPAQVVIPRGGDRGTGAENGTRPTLDASPVAPRGLSSPAAPSALKCRCRWSVQCTHMLGLELRDVREHLRTAHGEKLPDKGKVVKILCMWKGCCQRLRPASIPGHILAVHMPR